MNVSASLRLIIIFLIGILISILKFSFFYNLDFLNFDKMDVHIRSPLARMLYSKLQHQHEHSSNKHEQWYTVRKEYLNDSFMAKFIQLNQDDETENFLKNCYEKSDWLFTQLYHSIAKSVLTFFMSYTSANGLLSRGSMFVYSTKQFRKLMKISDDTIFESLLDLGAGDGRVTEKMSPNFKHIFTTEISSIMRWRLRQKNYNVLDINTWNISESIPSGILLENMNNHPQFDVVACLNLLDRCDKPLSLLENIKSVLHPTNGRLIVALVLPLKQYVETNDDKKPIEFLDVSGSHFWEIQFSSIIENVFVPIGYQLESWSVVPYLCEGDFSRSFYYLNDIVMVFKIGDS